MTISRAQVQSSSRAHSFFSNLTADQVPVLVFDWIAVSVRLTCNQGRVVRKSGNTNQGLKVK